MMSSEGMGSMGRSSFSPRTWLLARWQCGVFLLTLLLAQGPLLVHLGPPLAYADGGQADFSLQPVHYDPSEPLTMSYFIFDAQPAVVLNSAVRVTNTGTQTGTASLYPVDAATGQTSGAIYLNQSDPRRDVGAWITLGVQQLTLAPGQSRIVPFRLAIPAGMRPGQHLGGIVAEETAEVSARQTGGTNTSTFQVNVKNLTIIAVQVNLPGRAVERLAATGIQSGGANGYQRLLVGLSNTGTVMLKPSGTLRITGQQGQIVKAIPLSLDTFIPQTSIDYPVPITGQALGAGDYTAVLTLAYGHGQVLHYTTTFTVTQQQLAQVFASGRTQAPPGLFGADAGLAPWVLAGGVLLLLLVIGGLLYWFVLVPRARKQRSVPQPARGSQFKGPGLH